MTGVLAWAGVAVAGAAGAYARFAVGALVNLRRPWPFPAGTFVVNVTGAFALGLLTGLSVTGDALLVLGAGLLGSYTTFSTWMVEARRLREAAGYSPMSAYLAGSMVAGLISAGVGWLLGGALG